MELKHVTLELSLKGLSHLETKAKQCRTNVVFPLRNNTGVFEVHHKNSIVSCVELPHNDSKLWQQCVTLPKKYFNQCSIPWCRKILPKGLLTPRGAVEQC
ncbi:hypothetical protein RRG08_029974 [Elysia crispata]|uniref:Uncharacterized protein n=1 Tax=Elysia crispata TaxID=231223 RepID=A0AAE0ZKA5_9GAST|nr:hypothetical protein RRG08_029974 [Elysia crispata]